MVGGHQWRPHVSPPCSPASWPRSCVMGLAQAPGLFELPIRPWAPLRELVGGAPQLLAVGGVPWGFAPLCCGSQRAPGCPALPKGRHVAPSADLWSGCGQSFPPLLPPAPTPHPPAPHLGDPLHSRPAAWPAHGHSTQTAAPVAPFLPPRPSALLSRACCPKRMPSPWLRRKETWPQTLFWRPGRTSAHYRMAVTRSCPPGLRLGVLHSVTWLSASRLRGCAGFWGPVSVRVHVCLRDVRDCG